MTDQIWDDRAAAYVGARERLQLADQIKVQMRREGIESNGGELPAELPDEYWAAIAEASILAQLARTEATVGLLAGNYLVGQQDRIRRNRNRRRRDDVHARLNAARERAEHTTDGAPFDTAHRVIVTAAGEYQHRTGYILQNRLSAGEVPSYEVSLDPDHDDDERRRPVEQVWFSRDDLDLVIG